MTRQIYAIIGIGLLCAVGLLWFAFGSRSLRQYEVVSEGVLYRAAISNVDNFIDVEAKVSPAYVVMGLRDGEDNTEPWSSIIRYAYRNHIRVAKFAISPDGSVSDHQIDIALLPVLEGKRLPVLVLSSSGAPTGMVAAAYRLRTEKMPLDRVEKLAALPDAPADTTRRIRDFARAYSQAIRAGHAATPTTAPSATTAN